MSVLFGVLFFGFVFALAASGKKSEPWKPCCVKGAGAAS